MSFTVRVILLVVLAFIGTTLAIPAKSVRGDDKDAKPLVVCAVPAAMPRTGRAADKSPMGLDLAVAGLVARKLGRPLEIHWCASASCSWNCLREKSCDVVLGQPLDSGPKREVAWSVPYAGSQFSLVVERETKGVRSLADLRDRRVGIVAGTVAASAKDHEIVRFKTREELLEQFLAQKLHAAFVDGDFASWYLNSHADLPLRLVTQYVPRERWNMGVAVRTVDSDLLVEINRALSQIADSGDVRKVYAGLGVHYRAPFTNTAPKRVADKSWQRIREHGELIVSMDPANLPYSSSKKELPGFDVELARALADELGVKLQLKWIDVRRETAIGELLDGECDLAFGAAIDPNAFDDEEELAGKVIYSRPYYGTGYFLVNRADGPQAKSLTELKGEKSRRLGTEAGSVADYRLRLRGFQRRLFRTQLAVLKSLDGGGIDHAYLWANVGWTRHTTPEFKLKLSPDYTPEDHWNIAIAMRRGDDELKRHVDAAVAKLTSDDRVSRALARYHVPHLPPFVKETGNKATASPKSSATGSIKLPAVDRGLEPQMFRRQRSKKTYGGLERIRSAGTLIVGLDHNNLPFSTAHPKPAGLDYEVAGMLAKKLGVSLQIYWGYSSHDSYPSKLATKKFCDVMLGVMPDDRFSQRVIYSKPYYFARYQLVVRTDDDETTDLDGLADESLAVEPGVAVRAVKGRRPRQLPNLEAVLGAVDGGEVKAGYVISTRSHWLADKKSFEQIKFVDPPSTVDRFPICVALRKTDDDLKLAINAELDNLAQSGELAKVFARFHIPYESPRQEGN